MKSEAGCFKGRWNPPFVIPANRHEGSNDRQFHWFRIAWNAMETKKALADHCFRHLGGMDRVYEPAGGGLEEGKKHSCPDCSFCQSCAETRCLTCRSERNRKGAAPCQKLSFREQILMFEKINAEASKKKQNVLKSRNNLKPFNVDVER
jgi:hypothetical protein